MRGIGRRLIGLLFIFLGILCNPWFFEILFFQGSTLGWRSKTAIWILELAFVALGVLALRGKTFWASKRFHLLISISGLAASSLILQYLPVPYLWLAIIWTIISACLAISTKGSFWKAAWINVSVVIITLGAFEYYFYVKSNIINADIVYSDKYYCPDDILGTSPAKSPNPISACKYIKSKLIYDVKYTIGSNGLRIPPPCNQSDSECILFFGCSFTYGEGVNDNETMPYQVGIRSHGKYCTYNFGFHGYGPHQMLAGLENGLVGDKTDQRIPQHAIYQCLGAHVARSAGLLSWGKHGPRYVLKDDGDVTRLGNYDDTHKISANNTLAATIVLKELHKSFLLDNTIFSCRSETEHDIALCIAIIDKSRRVFEDLYPGSKFHILFWDTCHDKREDEMNKRVLKGLSEKGFDIHLISNILPNYNANKLNYAISVYDGHPNALAYELMAEYVIKHILSK